LSELLSVCSNLIVVDNQLDTLRFAHVSFKEFLETKPEFDKPSANRVAALSCLNTCIYALPIEIGSVLLPNQDYHQYAVLYWAQHYTASVITDGNKEIEELEEFILDDGLAFQLWLEAANDASALLPTGHCLKKELNAVMSESQTPFFTACVYGLKGIFDTSVQSPAFNADMTNLQGHTGLYLAAAYGNHDLVNALLGLGADPHVSRGKWEDPLSAACANGHSLVATLLLNQETYSDAMKIEPALRTCFLTGQEGLCKLLLKSYLQSPCDEPVVGRKDNNWLLEAAAQAGFSGVMEELVKVSSMSSTNHIKKNSPKFVTAVIRRGQINFIKKLLEESSLRADIVATAALFGNIEIINLCLDKGYNIEKEGPFGTPLRSACLMGHENAVRNLLSRGAAVNAVTPLGDALQAAAMKGHLSVTNILIQFHANVHNQGGFFGNALQAAAYRGHLDVTEALLSAGASIETKGRYKDAFHAAAEGGQGGVIGYFVERGYTFLIDGLSYGEARAFRGAQSVFKDVLRCASPSFRGYPQRPRQVFANQQRPEAFVSSFEDILAHSGDLLVSHDDIPESIYEHRARHSRGMYGERDYYALEVAASRGHLEVVERLLANRERLGIEVFHLGQALWAACTHGHITMVNSITSVEVDLRHYVRETLEIASSCGYGEIMEILIQHEGKWSLPSNDSPERASKCDTSQKDHTLQFDGSIEFPHTLPLVLAGCQGGQLASVKLGLRLATQFEIENIRELCLAEAARFGESDIVDFLIESDVPFSSEILAKAMHTAAENGSTSSLALLVSGNGDKEDLGDCYAVCLEKAVLNGHVEVVEYLLTESVRPWSLEILQRQFVSASSEGCLSIMISLAEKIQKHEAYSLPLTQALDAACAAGQKEGAQWLINAGADIDVMVDEKPELLAKTKKKQLRSSRKRYQYHSHEKWPRTALQACLQSIPDSDDAQIRSLESVINLLLEHGADVNQTLDSKMTALHVAIQNFSVETVRKMIAKGADVNIDVPGKGSQLQLTAERELNALPILHALLESGAIVGSCDDVQQQWKSVLNASLNLFGPNPLSSFYSFRDDDGRFTESESVQDILSTGPGAVIMHVLLSRPEIHTLDKRFGLLLQMLATSGDIDSIELLLDRGTDVNSCGHYYGCALQAAARFGHLECVQFLLDANAEVSMINGAHGTPLQAAIIGGHQEIVTELIAHGADPNLYSKDSYKSTPKTPPLQLSVQCNNKLLVKQLLNAGAKPEDGTAVLHLAVEAKDLETTKLLLLAGANIDFGDSDHSPALITACCNGDMEMVQALLTRGANVNIRGTKRQYSSDAVASGLHAACYQGYLEIAQVLLNHGADVNITAEDGKTPLGLAASKGIMNAIELLLRSGAIIYDQLTDINVLRDAAKGKAPRRAIKPLVQALSNAPELGSACEEAIEFAAGGGHKKLFLFLLDHVPKTSRTLNLACRLGCTDAVREILSYGVKIDSELENGEEAFHTALYHLRVDLALFLIGEGADVRHVSTKFGAPVSAVFEGLLASKSMSNETFVTFSFPWQWNDKLLSDLLPQNVLEGFGEPISDNESESEEEERSHGEVFNPSRIALAGNRKHASSRTLIDILLQAGAEVNPPATAIGTPLEIASYIGDMSMIDVLVKHGANLNSVGGALASPLIASMKGRQEKVFLNLLDRGIDVNIPLSKFGTALLYACEYGDLKKIQVLLEHGADPNANGCEGQSAIGTIFSSSTLHPDENRRQALDVILKYSKCLKISLADVALALKLPSYSWNKGIVETLYRHDKDLPVTRDVIAGVVASTDGSNSTGGLEMLLGRAKDVEITAEIFKSVPSPRILKILLQHELRCEITPDIFETLARHRLLGRGMVKVLLDQEPKALPTSNVVVSVLKSFHENSTDVMNTLQSVLARNPSISVSETMVTACMNANYLRILLSHDSQFRISSEFLETLTSDGRVDADSLKLMLEHDEKLRVSQASLNSCLEDGLADCVDLILGNNPDLIIPQELALDSTQETEIRV
jgi:ankyrin repeat protein